jgi:fimbrial isopeptide formation D2 family protein/LPXTG-motif cell wall-anchored protein
VKWGTALSNDTIRGKLISALQAETTIKDKFQKLTTDSSAKDFAAILETDDFKAGTNDANLVTVAKVIGDVLKSNGATATETVNSADYRDSDNDGKEDAYFYEASNLDAGYYTVCENTEKKQDTYTSWMMRIAGDETVNSKSTSTPEITKEINKITNPSTNTSSDPLNPAYSDVALGDRVQFRIETTVPEMEGYTYYQYAIYDTMTGGLDLYKANTAADDETAVSIQYVYEKNGKDTYADYTGDYAVTYDASQADSHSLKIVFKDFKKTIESYEEANGIEITKLSVLYEASVNVNAFTNESHIDRENNTASLKFSNDPTYVWKGTPKDDPDDPDDPDDSKSTPPTGEKPTDVVSVFATSLKVHKVDKDGNSLSGAEFTLTSTNGDITQIRFVDSITFEENKAVDEENEENTFGTGEYYKLRAGTFTTTAPTEGTIEKYDADNPYQTYDRVIHRGELTTPKSDTTTEGEGEAAVSTTTQSVSGEVDADGWVTFEGLSAGTYTLKETKTPAGYNTISDITFTIGFKKNSVSTGSDYIWTVSGSYNEDLVTFTAHNTEAEKYITSEVTNQKGSTLPETGGIGTKIIYALGAILAFAAAILLITRKRMNKADGSGVLNHDPEHR